MSESKNSKKEIIITSSKEGIQAFEDAIQAAFYRQHEEKLWFHNDEKIKNKEIEEYSEAKQASDYNPVSKTKIRKKNTHLTPKKKKRKK